MLKRLEMLGFKSFADKTAFEFGAGITCIVGPNGSGKSNVVDAIKWVLGEQSAKSLRGKEMADVIFNGSATRRSVGFAEATLVFDNARRILQVEADEVQLTRRVYRSGEGEYLINKTPSRLRDFRDLFMGTGADAYCVIEQGKVDVLLQSSTKDRRIIFEEAAGISRFKARKLEALRKLEHVDQNLLRLNDIVEEVEKQLRSVKLQAAKARRHQEYSDRLRALRIQIGLVDFHEFSLRLQEIESNAAQLGEAVANQSNRCSATDAKLLQVQSLVEDIENRIHAFETDLADCQQEIGRLDTQIDYERAHSHDLDRQIERLRGEWRESSSQVASFERKIATIRGEFERVDQEYTAHRSEVDAECAVVNELRGEAERGQQQIAEAQGRLMDLMQAANQLHNELAAIESREKSLNGQRQRLASRCDSLAGPLVEVASQIEALEGQEQTTALDREHVRRSLDAIDDQLEELWLSRQQTGSALAAAREERSAIAARVELLRDLEQRQEGVGSGVQHILASVDFAPNRVGLVADLLSVDVSHAAWIERALGDRAAAVVVYRRDELVERLEQLGTRLAGTVRFLALDRLTSGDGAMDTQAISADPGFIAHAASLVRPAVGSEALAAHLLGRTVVVQDLRSALRLAAAGPTGLRFVTATGDILEADGTITAGEPEASTGIVSRKSQLRAMQENALSLDTQIINYEQQLSELQQNETRVKQERVILEGRLGAAADQAARVGNLLSQRRQQLTSLNEELDLHRSEVACIDRELAELSDDRARRQLQTVHNAQERAEIERSVHEHESAVERALAEVEERQEGLTESKIELGKTGEKLANLRKRLAEVTTDSLDRQRVLSKTRQEIDSALLTQLACDRQSLAASSDIASLYLRKEKIGRETAILNTRRDQHREQRQSFASESHQAREKLQQLQSELHQLQLESSELKHQRATLDERIREDYEVQLATLYAQQQPDPALDRVATQQEIQELRRKITGLGNVNLEALAELQELETRSTTLHAQIDDLNQSKAALDEIIRKINQDSQRLFLETLESIRGHFSELFRKLFGGGRADILLENEADVLESGIEIVARPPGKELRSLSLLSGGEKTLTTAALLMAVFRAKPSPFCILDEVDAALDEANIERYTAMLREFATQAQFIMITHSKKSMVCADVLYGITMQESGVSKRVSVRFEDVGEQGEISPEALERSQPPDSVPNPTPNEQEAA